jgi:putative nucleotidyltransferase with HDIG domain
MNRLLRIYIASAATALVGSTLALYLSGYRITNPMLVIVLALVGLLAERVSVSLAHWVVVSISMLPALVAAVLLGPLPAMVVYGVSAFGLAFPILGRITYALNRGLVGTTVGCIAVAASHLVHTGLGNAVVVGGIAAICAGVADVALATVTYRCRGNRDWRVLPQQLLPAVLAASPFYGAVVALLTIAYTDVSKWTLPLFFAPALAAQRFFVLYQEQRKLADDLVAVNATLERANLSFASALVATLDARDRYTAGHSTAVAVYARDIAERMALPPDQQQLVHLCGLVHDIGKIGLPAGLLEKQGPLTLEERREMQHHAEIGERILANVETYSEIASIVRHHHERVDGEGYPDALVGDEIPLLSRIIAVADAYNAMTSDRPYRDALATRVARHRLAQAVESQFDTAVVAAFEALLAGANEDYRVARFAGTRVESQQSPADMPLHAADRMQVRSG